MGAVNYFSSDYITMGYDLSAWDENDFSSYEEMEEEKAVDMDEMFSTISEMIECRRFWYFHITIKYGYYEGFSLDIENNFPVAFDNWEDKRDAQKEVTQMKAFLFECVNMGLCQVFPGWCTSYLSRSDSLQGIKKAIAAMREEIRNTPTWTQYNRQGA